MSVLPKTSSSSTNFVFSSAKYCFVNNALQPARTCSSCSCKQLWCHFLWQFFATVCFRERTFQLCRLQSTLVPVVKGFTLSYYHLLLALILAFCFSANFSLGSHSPEDVFFLSLSLSCHVDQVLCWEVTTATTPCFSSATWCCTTAAVLLLMLLLMFCNKECICSVTRQHGRQLRKLSV